MNIKKLLTGLIIFIVLLLISGFIFLNHIKTKGLPEYDKNIVLEGVIRKVEIIRDSLAIPHIYAENENDLYIAVGYVMAQDRLWQMDLLRRATTGRLSEIFGKDLAETDLLFRSLKINEKSQLVLSNTDDIIKASLVAFCKGVNQYIEQNKKTLPPEFALLKYKPEKWLPEHSVNLIGYMAWDLAAGWGEEVFIHKLKNKIDDLLVNELIPDLNFQNSIIHEDYLLSVERAEIQEDILRKTAILEDLGIKVFNASNNWAVSGEKSLTGKPLLANDMHLGLSVPGIWYQMHLIIPDKINVTGVALPGQPMVVAGHNDKIAWGFTNVMVDNCDFYLETINPENDEEYLFNGEWKKLEIKKEIIYTSDGDTLEFLNKFTHRGPVVSDFHKLDNKQISMSWTGNDYSNEFRTIYLLNRAENWDDFKDAIKTFTAVCQNVVYADIEGNIGLYSIIGLPIRKGDGITIYSGETDEYDWKGKVAFEDLPYTYNPECGYVSSANNRTASADYLYYISSWYDLPYRFDRINEMLKAKDKFSVEDFVNIQTDQKSKMAEKFTGIFIQAIKEDQLVDVSDKEAFALLKNWNYKLNKESSAATVFEYLYYYILKELTSDELGEELSDELNKKKILVKNLMEGIMINNYSEWVDNINTERVENFSDIVTEAFLLTIDHLSNEMGKNTTDWNWGEIHEITLYHPIGKLKFIPELFGLNSGTYSVGGSYHTVAPFSYPYMSPEEVNHGASHRHIFSISDWDKSLTVIPTGTSGIPASKYFCDQTPLYINNEYHHDYFSRSLVLNSAKYKMNITGK